MPINLDMTLGIFEQFEISLNEHFDNLSAEQRGVLLMLADQQGYSTPKIARGSRAQCFFNAIVTMHKRSQKGKL